MILRLKFLDHLLVLKGECRSEDIEGSGIGVD
jgi:hypothetical protein